MLQGPGENAGVIDLGDGEAVCFKVESHNHPSAVEPFQGAATGVGGILRDIIAMGARPIALLDGLRFGPGDPRFDRAVAGIGAYGNSVGVPTVGGEAVFDEAYRDNVLVNAMCVGLLPADRIARAGATGPGNLVVLYGATTGRDGIGGASVLASQELGEDDADKRPTVQVGDPFMGKKLIEVSVELVESGLVESLQDCGAAGLASSLSEMARECGIDLRLDAVPLREEGMEPWEVMISESQERMVAVVRPQMLEQRARRSASAGSCTTPSSARSPTPASCARSGTTRSSARSRRGCSPTSARATRVEPKPRDEPSRQSVASPSTRPRIRRRSSSCSAATTSAAAQHVYRRYDHLVGSRTVRRPGLDAAVLRLRPGYRGLAVSLDGTGRMGRLDPRTGGRLAVLEAARNVACTGAEPLGLTDCLNFGNPEKGAIAWELVESIEGMAEACEALGIPIVSGNVSLYNETDGRAIDPTPVVGCVGLLEDVRRVPGAWREGDVVLLAGASPVALAGSEYQARFGEVGGRPARLDLEAEAALVEFLWRAAPHCSLVHDVSLGGLAVALAKAALHSGIGAEVTLPDDPRAWFGEGGGQAVLACAPGDVDRLGGVPIRRLGIVGGDSLLGIPLAELQEAHG